MHRVLAADIVAVVYFYVCALWFTPYITTGVHLYLASIVSTVADQSTGPGLCSAQTARYFTPKAQKVELLESGRFHTLVLQPGINSPNVYTTYQTLLLLENTWKHTFSLVVINF